MSPCRASLRPGLPLLLALVSVAGCVGAPSEPRAPASPRSGVPSAAAFFADPPLAHPRLSPDGERIAGVTSRDGTLVLIEKPVRGDAIRHLGKFEASERLVHALGWVGDGAVALALERPAIASGGMRQLEVSVFHPERWRPSRVAPIWGLPASARTSGSSILHWLPDDPEQLLVSGFDGDERSLRARRVRVRSGVGQVVSPPGLAAERWFTDARGRLRAAIVPDPDGLGDTVYARAVEDAPFAPLVEPDLARESSLEFAGFASDPQRIYVYATTEAGRRGVYETDLAGQTRGDQIASHPEFDVAGLLYAPRSDVLWAVEVVGERPERIVVDEAGGRELASIDATFPGTTNRIVDSDGEGAMALVEVSGDTSPPRTYVYQRGEKEMTFLYAALPELERATLAPMRAVRYPARDGLEIPAYLTLPPGAEPRALPTIVLVHDGPTQRDRWGWDARVQFLASRGFAVLQPNYRGSGGYGREFERRGHAAWGGAMQDDLVDGVAFLVAEGIADPDRVGLFGVGYGGYAALMGPITAPGVFRAVASWGGISDLVESIEHPELRVSTDPNLPLDWATLRDRERLAGISPRQGADRIRVPVLLGHGDADRMVRASHSEAMARALEAAGTPVELRLYRGETHAFHVEAHRIDFHEALATFFATHLESREAL